MAYKLCALIPTYNHHSALPGIVRQLCLAGLPVFIVDDGSDHATQATLRAIEDVEVLQLRVNGGKGAAIESGLRWVAEHGYTHAFQIDADGQHALDDLAKFMALSKRNPQALLSGKPVYDASMPLTRKIGRWFTHFWVWIETLSFRISDSMCGFRIYPIQASLAIMDKASIGKRMDFDTEIMVRLFWEGTPVIMHPVRVCYPEGNLSNFDLLRDNWRITKMHTRLLFTMLAKLPAILKRRPDYTDIDEKKLSWSKISERGTLLGILLLATCCRLLGRTLCSLIGAPVVLYFYLTGSKQRRASSQFLRRAFRAKDSGHFPSFLDGWRHFMSFFQMLLDKFAAWGGQLSFDSIECDHPEYIQEVMSGAKGGMMLVSHLGCMEFCRALMPDDQKKRMHILMHSKNARQFTRVMRYFNPHSSLNIIEVVEIGADTIMYLKERVEQGDWVVIAADRTPISEKPRVTVVPFLGAEAPFSQGPYILASLLQCPVYTAMAIRIGSKYNVSIELFAEEIILPRGKRETCLKECAHKYARYLESYCVKYPYQWFNFFDFWTLDE